MKKTLFVIIALSLGFVLSFLPRPAWADPYDESQSHPLRVTAYLLHPIGRAAEVLLARPFHSLVSRTPKTEWLFGHTPHEPLFKPSSIRDFGVSRRYDLPSGHDLEPYLSSSRQSSTFGDRMRGRQPDDVEESESGKRVVIKEVVVKEVPKVVEVKEMVLPDVAFEFDSDQLTPLGKGQVYLAAQLLRKKSDVVIVIEGHADHIGTDEYNMGLGLRRAQRVRRELEELGISPAAVSVVSVGESRPLIDQGTEWARAVNRRVELKIEASGYLSD